MYQQIMKEVALMELSIKKVTDYGKELAIAERDYNIAVASETLRLKEQSYPVTIISKLVKGNKEIAKLQFERDIADTMYRAANETIQVKKYKVKIMENQYDKEWGATK